MRKVGGNSGRVDNIKERELGNELVLLEQQRHGLSDSTRSTEHGDFKASLCGRSACEAKRGCKDMRRHDTMSIFQAKTTPHKHCPCDLTPALSAKERCWNALRARDLTSVVEVEESIIQVVVALKLRVRCHVQ